MRLRHIPGAKEFVSAHPMVIEEEAALSYRGHWRQLFASDGDLLLEIGMGRGRFIVSSALRAPETNFLGLELREEMVMDAIARVKQDIPNLRFLHANAGLLAEMFAQGELSRIYIHFPDPWPKSRHAKRRLTAVHYLEVYRKILARQGELLLKTDNRDLFEWSLVNFKECGFALEELDFDLQLENSGLTTEYERRFRERGLPIFFVRVRNV